MKTQKQFFGRAASLSFGLLVLLALAVLLAACTADTVNINGTYEYKEKSTIQLRLTRGSGNAIGGGYYYSGDGSEPQKTRDVYGSLEDKNYEINIKLTFSARPDIQTTENPNGLPVETVSGKVLDYGNAIRIPGPEGGTEVTFTKKK